MVADGASERHPAVRRGAAGIGTAVVVVRITGTTLCYIRAGVSFLLKVVGDR